MAEVWRFETRNYLVTCDCAQERFDASYMDPELAEEVRRKIASGKLSCFSTRIEVMHRPSGEVIGKSFMGGSIYADPKEFVAEHIGIRAKGRRDGHNYGCYFSDLVSEAIAEAREHPKGRKISQAKVSAPLFGLHCLDFCQSESSAAAIRN